MIIIIGILVFMLIICLVLRNSNQEELIEPQEGCIYQINTHKRLYNLKRIEKSFSYLIHNNSTVEESIRKTFGMDRIHIVIKCVKMHNKGYTTIHGGYIPGPGYDFVVLMSDYPLYPVGDTVTWGRKSFLAHLVERMNYERE